MAELNVISLKREIQNPGLWRGLVANSRDDVVFISRTTSACAQIVSVLAKNIRHRFIIDLFEHDHFLNKASAA